VRSSSNVQPGSSSQGAGRPGLSAEAADGLVDYFRCISGEHPNWQEYREAMRIQDKSLIRITPTRWGPIATGGFPADVAARLDG
jgi:hypothetical protein